MLDGLSYLGIQEVVKIRQLGYPVRSTLRQFWTRYKVLRTADMEETKGGGIHCYRFSSALTDLVARDLRLGDAAWLHSLANLPELCAGVLKKLSSVADTEWSVSVAASPRPYSSSPCI